MGEDCIFCAIVAGQAPAEILHQDEHTLTFLDINPWARGHALVVPRRHAKNLHDVEQGDLEHTMLAARRLTERAGEALGCEDVMLLNSSGRAAWQVVNHFHLHVIPRYRDDAFRFPQPERADRDELAKVAAEIRG